MLELGIDAMALDIQRPEGLNQVQCQVIGGHTIPIQVPGQNGPMRVPAVVVNFSLNKQAALEYAKKLQEEAEQLPDERVSDISIAQNLQDVERIADADRRFRG